MKHIMIHISQRQDQTFTSRSNKNDETCSFRFLYGRQGKNNSAGKRSRGPLFLIFLFQRKLNHPCFGSFLTTWY